MNIRKREGLRLRHSMHTPRSIIHQLALFRESSKDKCVVYAAVFGEELQQCIVFSQRRRYNSRKAIGPGPFLLAPARKGGTGHENQL